LTPPASNPHEDRRRLRRDRWKAIAGLTLPVATEQLLNISMGVVNALMVSNIGTRAVSGISLVDSLNNVVMAFFSAVALGGTVAVAHHFGRKDHEGANAVAAQALRSGTLIGLAIMAVVVLANAPLLKLLFFGADDQVLLYGRDYLLPTALSYPFLSLTLIASGVLRGAGDTKTPMVTNILMNVVNVFLGWLFIYGFAWGVSGAGFANLGARIVGAALILGVLLWGKRRLAITGKALKHHNRPVRRAIYRIGPPTGVESLLFSGGKLITQTFIASLGTVALASNFVASSLAVLVQLPGSALAIACTTLVGQALGRKDPVEAKAAIRYTLFASCLSLLVVGVVGIPLAPWLVGLFTRDPAVIETATGLLQLILAVGPFLWAPSFQLPAGLRGAGDTTYPMVVTLVGMWVFRIGLGWVFAFPWGLGVMGVWLAMFVDWLVRSVLFLLRFNGQAWQKREVHPELAPADLVSPMEEFRVQSTTTRRDE